MATLTAQDVADYFLSIVDEEQGDSLSNLKLQKLLYYAQGFHLAIKNEPLFDEDIEAWTYGPVVPSVYNQYSQHGGDPIPKPDKVDLSKRGRVIPCLSSSVYPKVPYPNYAHYAKCLRKAIMG